MGKLIHFSVEKKDTGLKALQELAKRLRDRESYVKVGFVGEKGAKVHDETRLSMGELATVHEFGAPAADIPARPFLRPSFDKGMPAYIRLLTALLKGVYEGKGSIENALGLVGARASADVKLYVTAGESIPPPNAPATLERKQAKGSGLVRTLVDIGQMVGAVTWQVVMQGNAKGESE